VGIRYARRCVTFSRYWDSAVFILSYTFRLLQGNTAFLFGGIEMKQPAAPSSDLYSVDLQGKGKALVYPAHLLGFANFPFSVFSLPSPQI
jgi:hypothetical protein